MVRLIMDRRYNELKALDAAMTDAEFEEFLAIIASRDLARKSRRAARKAHLTTLVNASEEIGARLMTLSF